MNRVELTIIGTGRAAASMAAAARARGIRVSLWGRDSVAARRLARRLDLVLVNRLEEAVGSAQTLLLAVRDDALSEVAARLARCFAAQKGRIVALHMAGSRSSKTIRQLGEAGCSVGVFHPLQPLLVGLPLGGFVSISGDRAARSRARALAKRLQLTTIDVADEARPLLHLGAMLSAGQVVALLDLARATFEQAGLARGRARQVTARLAASAVQSFAAHGAGAMTGPVVRGDAETLAAHDRALTAWRGKPAPLATVNRALLQHAIQLALEGGAIDRGTGRRLLLSSRLPPRTKPGTFAKRGAK